MAGFKPFGMPLSELKSVTIQFDEYESINLVNYKGLGQDEAAERMGVSRPTFTRIYNHALKKIAKAFVECTSIKIEGGNVEYSKQWYKCKKCYKLIDGLENHQQCGDCKSFGDNELIKLTVDNLTL
jgi:predicted DNA-binding protein (UPF0251 family)